MAATPAPTLRALLNRRDLGLRLAEAADDLPRGALDAPLRWVHSSDLADPTPFLTDDLLLLTTGTQFDDASGPESYRDYVARLARRGVRGLGFGTEVVRHGIPTALAEACRKERMPLFEVPYRTPFIALAQANAEAVAAQAYARRSWALAAQRAISLAALQPDGLGATLAELGRQLEAWVGLFDAAGALVRDHPAGGLATEALTGVTGEVSAMLRRGVRAGSSLESAGQSFTLQTLGRGGQLRGAIAIAATGLDAEGRGVLTSVIAMAGLALEQTVGLNQARGALRTGLVRSLLSDDPSVAAPVVAELWTPLPAAPIVVAVAGFPATRAQVAADWLERQTGSVFHGQGPDGLVIVLAAADQPLLDEFAALFEAAAGVSRPCDYHDFSEAHAQAVAARARGGAGRAIRFAELAGDGVLAQLSGSDATAIAEAQLAPLREHDRRHGTALLHTVRVWLECDARIETAAQALGVHRHTVRTRVAQAQKLLGVDLAGFPARAELWAALVATR